MANTISDKLTYLEGTKSAIKDAIVAKGVAVSDSDTFRSYADKIGQISGGGGGKINLNDYGLTFANSNMSNQQYNEITYTLNEYIPYFFNKATINAVINLFNLLTEGVVYYTEGTFENLRCEQIIFPSTFTISSVTNTFRGLTTTSETNPSILDNLIINSTAGYTELSFSETNLNINNITFNFDGGNSYYLYGTFISNRSNQLPEKITVNISDTTAQLNLEYWFSPDMDQNDYPEIDLTNVGVQQVNNFLGFYDFPNFHNFKGIINLNADLDLSKAINLNNESVYNVINKAADLSGKDSKTITFASSVFNAITEEQKALATSKNWSLASA